MAAPRIRLARVGPGHYRSTDGRFDIVGRWTRQGDTWTITTTDPADAPFQFGIGPARRSVTFGSLKACRNAARSAYRREALDAVAS